MKEIPMSTADDLRNSKYHSAFDRGEPLLPPASQVALLACMDVSQRARRGQRQPSARSADSSGTEQIMTELINRGFTDVVHVEGGFPKWKHAGGRTC